MSHHKLRMDAVVETSNCKCTNLHSVMAPEAADPSEQFLHQEQHLCQGPAQDNLPMIHLNLSHELQQPREDVISPFCFYRCSYLLLYANISHQSIIVRTKCFFSNYAYNSSELTLCIMCRMSAHIHKPKVYAGMIFIS